MRVEVDYMKTTNIKSLIIIILLVVFSLSATYAFLTLTANNNSANGIGGCFNVNYSAQDINNTALVSTTDYTQGASSNVILSKNADCEIYTEADIMIHTNDTTDAPISDGALKYKILKDSEVISEGAITTTDPADTKLATVDLTETDVTYKVYIWIDSSISNGAYNGKSYSGYLFANAIQTSTIQ